MRRLAATVAVFGAFGTALAGCSSDEPPTESPPTSAKPTHGAFANCLSEHGVPAATGPQVAPPHGVDAASWQRALHACSSLAPGPG